MNGIRSHHYLLPVALAAVAGLVAGFGLVRSLLGWPLFAEQTASGSSVSFASLIPPPKSVAELVGKADVIVIGTVGPVVNQGAFEGYDGTGNLIPPSTGHPDLPITDFQIIVEKVLKDDGTIRAGNPPILRMLGHPTNKAERDANRTSHYPMSYTGDRHLFFLSKNPDATYGFYYGPWSRLVIDGQVVALSDGPRTPVQFAGRQFAPAEFIASVTQSIR